MGKFKPFDKFEHLDSIAVCHEYIKLLEAELRKARADALEEAARVLDGSHEKMNNNADFAHNFAAGYQSACFGNANQIRALKGEP